MGFIFKKIVPVQGLGVQSSIPKAITPELPNRNWLSTIILLKSIRFFESGA